MILRHRRVYLFSWILCFVMFVRCNWQGNHEIAGIYCVLMFLSSGMEHVAERIESIMSSRRIENAHGRAFTSHRGR